MTGIQPRKHPKVLKPLVGIRAVHRMLLRSVDATCPEVQLIVSVISQAIADCSLAETFDKAAAKRFMYCWRLEAWAQAVGLDPCFVREVAIKTHYLNADACPPPIGQPRALTSPYLTGPFNNQQKHSDRSFDARLQ
jgi:hypothetical protein